MLKDFRIVEDNSKRVIKPWGEEIAPQFNQDKKIQEKKKFGAHLDVITNVACFAMEQEQYIATTSEDCLIKLWSVSGLIKDENPEPKHTLRKHTGPLFSLAVNLNPWDNSQNLIFSGGI